MCTKTWLAIAKSEPGSRYGPSFPGILDRENGKAGWGRGGDGLEWTEGRFMTGPST
jgi:hypothetical protein